MRFNEQSSNRTEAKNLFKNSEELQKLAFEQLDETGHNPHATRPVYEEGQHPFQKDFDYFENLDDTEKDLVLKQYAKDNEDSK